MTIIEIVLAALALLAIGLAIAAHSKASTPATSAPAPAPTPPVDHVGIINAVANVVAAGQSKGAPPPVAAAPAAHLDPVGINWAAYAGKTDRTAFFSFATRMGRPPSEAEQAAAYAAGVVRTILPQPTTDPANPASSFGPLDSLTGAYQHGRWTFKPNEPIVVPIVAPAAGPFHFACSGSGGVPGGDSSVRVALSVADASGAVVGTGGDNPPYAGFTAAAAGDRFTLTMTAPAATIEDVTLAPGVA